MVRASVDFDRVEQLLQGFAVAFYNRHLYGAEHGTLWADDDADGRADRIIEYADTDGDGYFDRWQFDDGADGSFERTHSPDRAYDSTETPIPLEWESVTRAYVPLLEAAVAGHEQVARALGEPLTESPFSGKLEIHRWVLERRIHQAFHHAIADSAAAGNEARATALEAAREYWERGLHGEAARRISAD